MILLSTASLLHLVDDNLPIGDPDHSVVNLSPPFEQIKGTKITVVGTFNGIALLLLTHNLFRYYSPESTTSRIILYNPLTRAYKEVLNLNPSNNDPTTSAIGFGYGATPDDLKIVTIDVHKCPHGYSNSFYVYDVKTNSRSKPLVLTPAYRFRDRMEGTIVNGFLYWVAYYDRGLKRAILAFNVKEMVVSKIDLPDQCGSIYSLGSLNGCLCFINMADHNKFDVRMVKDEEEEGVIKKSWSKVSSFAFGTGFGLGGNGVNVFYSYAVRILDQGRIIMGDGSTRLSIYDISQHSSKSLVSVRVKNLESVCGIEYVESFVSP